MTDPALPANDPPPPDDSPAMLVTIDDTGAATHVGCGGDVAVLTDDHTKASCDICKLVVGVETVSVAPEPPASEAIAEVGAMLAHEGFDTSDEHLPADHPTTPVALSFDSVKSMTGIGTGEPFADAEMLARAAAPAPEESDETPPPLPEPSWRDPQCIDRHLSGCGCTGDARAPI